MKAKYPWGASGLKEYNTKTVYCQIFRELRSSIRMLLLTMICCGEKCFV